MSATAQSMTGGNKVEPLQELVDSFHTLLDKALIVAIAGDFNLHDPSAYKEARSTLEGLAQSVPSEEASGFNPSGILQAAEEADHRSPPPELAGTSTTSTSHSTSQAYATNKSSTDTSSCVPDFPGRVPRLTYFNKDSQEDKVLVLQNMFAELKPYDIEYALKKADGDFQVALDDLLNIQYLQSTGQQMKGVDGFFVADSATKSNKRKKKKKKKGKRIISSDLDISSDGISSPPRISLEENGQDDVEYIAERFGIRSDEVTPIYHKCQGSKGATVVELLNQYISHGIKTQNESGKEASEALVKQFRHVPTQLMPTIVHVSGAIPQFAEDIAALLNRHFSKRSKGKKIDLAYRLTPLPQDEIEGGVSSPGLKPSQTSLAGKTALSSIKSVEEAMNCANAFHQARRDAAASAAQLHRRGASSPLYRQAAAYYTDRAREQAMYAQSATSTVADLLVGQKSTPASIDLHGVLVHDGVRIARQKVQDWWQGLGEMRAKRVREQGGFTVITGLGRHSAGGVSHLRQAVAAALLQDGWKMTVETGKFVVTGRR
ncbi:hypothetical protein EsDP_00004416 [Epichloe bromicola]|uniref:Smr domain-containing protein n=1 Tax=Epichloe bromicola TaxID=79588 RepID=A0ABQ0CRM7_9HYPO